MRIVKAVAKKTGYIVAACIILLAIVVVVSRLFISSLDAHRSDFEKMASDLLGLPVTMKQVRVSWYQYQPQIRFDEVTLLDKQTNKPKLQIKQVRLFISIPKSIWNWRFVQSGVMISGADIALQQSATGQIAVQGFPAMGGFDNQPYQTEAKFNEMLKWLSAQPRIILRDIDLRYHTARGIDRYVTLFDLHLDNDGKKHVIQGEAILHQDLPTNVKVTAKWMGDTMDITNIKAKILLQVSGFSIAQWLKDVTWQGWRLDQGLVNAKIWLYWNRGVLHRIQSTYEAYNLALYSMTDKSKRVIPRMSGNVGWKREGKTQVFAGDDIFIDFPTHLWPSTNFYVLLSEDANQQLTPTAINLGYIDLQDVQSFLSSSPPLLSAENSKILQALNLTGSIQNAAMTFAPQWDDWQHLMFTASLSRLNVTPYLQYPGFKNLSATIKGSAGQATLTLQGKNTEITYPSIFAHPILFDQLTGDISSSSVTSSNGVASSKGVIPSKARDLEISTTTKLNFTTLTAQNSDLTLTLNGTVVIPSKQAAILDLSANFTITRAQYICRYLPLSIFDKDLTEWLQQAFLSGQIENGKAIIQGSASDFPFDANQGKFEIDTTVKDLTFSYAPHWPVMSHVGGRLLFSGRQMVVDLSEGAIGSIPISKVHGEIPYLGDAKPQILTVQSEPLKADFEQGLAFVHKSPLEKTIGKMFQGVKMHGPMALTLGLTVPLSHPDDTTVSGDIAIEKTQLDLVPWELAINDLHGQLHFTEKSTLAKNIEGTLFGKPLTLDLDTVPKGGNKKSVVRATVATQLVVTDIEKWLKLPASTRIQGATNAKIQLDFLLDAPIDINLQSDLVGIALDLPDQYAKKAEVPQAFTLQATVQEKQPLRLQLAYSKLLTAALILDRKNQQFDLTAANIHLGAGAAAWPTGAGLYLSGNLDKLDWEKIKSYDTSSSSSNGTSLPLRGIDMQIAALNLPGMPLSKVRLQLTPTDTEWEIDLTSNEVDGQLDVPKKINARGLVNVELTKLKLSTSKNSTPTVVDAKALPSIIFTASNVSYNAMSLGKVSFKTEPTASGLAIRSFNVVLPQGNLSATGSWVQQKNSNQTRLDGAITSSNISAALSGLGFDVHNFVAKKGRVDIKLNWQATPMALALANMNGQVNLDIGQGRIVEVSDTNNAKMDLGKMLSIFSLQTIPRRLSFDFSDVFQKGYSFDSFRGDINIRNGNAFTSNTRFDGPVARVNIFGRIGFDAKDYDLTLSVTPYVTSSIPVAATLLTGQPAIGLAVWAVNKAIGSQVSKVTTYYYSVRGPWSNPAWASVKQ